MSVKGLWVIYTSELVYRVHHKNLPVSFDLHSHNYNQHLEGLRFRALVVKLVLLNEALNTEITFFLGKCLSHRIIKSCDHQRHIAIAMLGI